MTSNFIIPKPKYFEPREGFFNFTPATKIWRDEPNQWNATYLQDLLALSSPSLLPENAGETDGVNLQIDSSLESLREEGYHLLVRETHIEISAPTTNGVFYGIQSLRQLLPVEIENLKKSAAPAWKIPCCEIIDSPRFPWRGTPWSRPQGWM